jgi:hypothetical protein
MAVLLEHHPTATYQNIALMPLVMWFAQKLPIPMPAPQFRVFAVRVFVVNVFAVNVIPHPSRHSKITDDKMLTLRLARLRHP